MNTQTPTQSAGIRPDLSESREVHGFERVSLRGQNIQNNLVITQGQRETLLIEASPDLLPRVKTSVIGGELIIRITGGWSDLVTEALTTGLTRQRIKYTLTVRQLSVLDIVGLTHLNAATLDTDRLALRFRGPGKANFTSLQARLLEVDISGPCKVEVAGQVAEQRVSINAIGFYYAPQMESKKAIVHLNGPGQATIWVTGDLDATISGPGRLEYYGAPRVNHTGFPFGNLVSLGEP